MLKAREGGGLGWDTACVLCEAAAQRHRLIREASPVLHGNTISSDSALMFGEQQLRSALADYIKAALMLRVNDRALG